MTSTLTAEITLKRGSDESGNACRNYDTHQAIATIVAKREMLTRTIEIVNTEILIQLSTHTHTFRLFMFYQTLE